MNVTKNIYVGLHCSILHAKVIDWKRRTSIEGHQFLRLKYVNGVVWLLRDYAKSHTVYGLVSTSVTLNDLESRNSPYFVLFHRIHSMALQAYYVTLTVVEDRPILFAEYRRPLLAKTDHPAEWCLCDS